MTIMFRGREQSRPELGYRLLQRLAGDVEELGFVESQPKQDGRNMIMVIGPHKRKPDAKAERAPRPNPATRPAADQPVPAPARPPGATPQAVAAAADAGRGRRADRDLTGSAAAELTPRPEPCRQHAEQRIVPPGTPHERRRRRHAEDEDPQRANKRFRLTGTGKVMRRRANRAHHLEHKPSTRTRRLATRSSLSPADTKKMKRLLGK